MQISAEDALKKLPLWFTLLVLRLSSVKPASQTHLLAAEAETEPALQWQKWLPGFELDREGHTKQSPTPAENLYVPASHATQVPPSDPVYPRLQTQLDRNVEPLDEWESAGQAKHTDALFAAIELEYFPA
jgi:hypothetical protein